jgi:acetoin utilization protein AcuB
MSQIPSVGSVMTPSPRSVRLDASVREAEDQMIEHEIRHLPVVDDGVLVGLLSDRDIAFLSNGPASELRDKLCVRDVCSLEVYAVSPATPLDEVLSEMAARRVGSAVVAEGERVEGLFTTTDACRCFADVLRARRGGG